MTARKPTFFASATSVQRWLRALLVCTVFAALQGTLGAWVVPAVSGSPAVQVCTPHGLQWVALELVDGDVGDGEDGSAGTLKQPCVWAAAHTALTATSVTPTWLGAPSSAVTPPMRGSPSLPASDRVWRVLLMSAMRAPPGQGGLAPA